MSFDFLKENLEKIQKTIADSCSQAGRDVSSVTLLPVTKVQPIEKLKALYDLGEKSFGENRVQELNEKAAKLSDDIEWHLIGSLQSNKVRQALKYASWIHSVDSLKLINRIEKIAGEDGVKPKILLQVNLTDESQKGGFDPDKVEEAVELASNCQNLDIVGLMTMGKAGATDLENREVFKLLKQLQVELSEEYPQISEISMGMSGDFPLAILEGATYIRVGSLLLGAREY